MESEQAQIKKLVDYINESVDTEEDFHFLRFESLQRLNFVKFEVDLAWTKSQLINRQCGSVQRP